jgi:hypothetical protein
MEYADEQFLELFRARGWFRVGTLAPNQRYAIQRIVSKYEPEELLAFGLRMRVATRAYTTKAFDYIRGRDGTTYSHFQVL